MKLAFALMLLVFVAGCTAPLYTAAPEQKTSPVQTPQATPTPVQQVATPQATTQQATATPTATPASELTLTITVAPVFPVGRALPIVVEASYNKNLESLELSGEGVTNNLYTCSGTSCKNTWTITFSNPGTYEYTAAARASDKQSATKTAKIIAR